MPILQMRPSIFVVWWLAIRPKTLSLSWIPVMVGASLAWKEHGKIAWLATLVAGLSAIFIQIGTNLHNDAKDWEHGIDQTDRQGPQRATAMGWLTAKQVVNAAYLAFVLALILGLYLIWVGGTFILLLGIFSIISGLAYTGGPFPIAYSSLGEIFVFLFFGLGSVIGTYYLNTGSVSSNSVVIGVVMGLFAAAVLMVNNYRDIYSDQAVGKLTLAIYLGPSNIRVAFTTLIILPFFLVAGYGWLNPLIFITWLAMPIALWLIFKLFQTPPSPACNVLLARTAQLQLIFGLLLIVNYLS